MIVVTAQSRIYLAVKAIDFRKGIDGLSALCQQMLKTDPFSGSLFIFCNRRKTAIKILAYDGQGFWLCIKRLSQGKFQWWLKGEENMQGISAKELQVLLWNGNPQSANLPGDWRKIT